MKEFLENNKIFFEVGNIVIFTLVTVVLAGLTYCNQLKTNAREIILSQPDIRVRASLRKDDNSNQFNHEELFVENFGGRLGEVLSFAKAVFLVQKDGPTARALPITFFIATSEYHNLEGTLFRCHQPNNNARQFELAKSYPGISLEKFVTIKYTDLFGETHSKCFANTHLGKFSEAGACDRLKFLEEKTHGLTQIDIDNVTLSDIKNGAPLQ